jgi:hypothetical protein
MSTRSVQDSRTKSEDERTKSERAVTRVAELLPEALSPLGDWGEI